MEKEFIKELEQLINKYSIDVRLGMPDFIIAELVNKWLNVLYIAIQNTENWKKH
jgi:hypothetical protein